MKIWDAFHNLEALPGCSIPLACRKDEQCLIFHFLDDSMKYIASKVLGCYKNDRFTAVIFGAPAGIRITIESPGGAFLAQCKHWASPLSAAPPLMQANPSLSSFFCLFKKRFLQAAVRAAFLVLQRGFHFFLPKTPIRVYNTSIQFRQE